jgi:hypothetical protein
MKLTIGMASYNNYAETWFTIQTLRMYHDLAYTEILVVDNFGDDRLRDFITSWGCGQVRYIRDTDRQGTAYPRQRIFDNALGEWVMVIDSHVMLAPGAVARFKEWAGANSDCRDLLHGPMLYDDHINMADSMSNTWAGNMWGVWNMRRVDDDEQPYEIPMHGLGLFACRRDAWLGFNSEFRGFGGEEGYIHQKFRNAGHRVLCLPWLKWMHKFNTIGGVCQAPYSPQLADIIHNYETGFAEVELDPAPMRKHFNTPGPQITNIQIDPNAGCGSKCWFCPVRYIKRPAGQTMPQDLFEKILNDITAGVAAGSIAANFTLWLSSYNDILLDPLLEKRLAALRIRGMKFCCLTNGIGLLKHHQLLHDYRDVVVCYSVDLPAGDPASYARHTLNPPELFDTIISGLQALHSLDPSHYTHAVQIGINGAYDEEWNRRQLIYDLPLGDTNNQLQQLQSLLPHYPRIEAMRPLCDRAGYLSTHAIDNAIDRRGTTGCNRLTEWIHVNSFGQVYACCQDYLEEYKYGDLAEQSLDQVIRQRGSFKEIKEGLCRKCTFSKE